MTTREQAMQWWNSFELSTRQSLWAKYYKGNFNSFTDLGIEKIWRKENKTEENIYLNRLKEQYKQFVIESKTHYFKNKANRLEKDYQAMRLFCLDTQLVSFNDIEVMEFEVNQSF